MSIVLWTLFDLAVNLFQSIMFVRFVFNTLQYKSTRISRWIPYIGFSLLLFATLSFINYLVVFEGLAAVSYSLILFLLATIFFYGPLAKKVIISIIPIVCVIVTTVFGTNLTSALFHCPIINLLSEDSFYRVFMIAVVNFLFVILLHIIQTFFIKNDVTLTKIEWLFIAVILCVSVIVLACLYFITFSINSEILRPYIAIIMISIIAVDAITYFLLIQLSKKHQIVLENTLLKQQYEFHTKSNQIIKEQYENIQKIRHDFKNSLKIIRQLNNSGNHQGVERYISEYLQSTASAFLYVSTNNEFVNAIINLKLEEAKKQNIIVTLDIISSIDFPDAIGLCNIIGNLFDNAIEACQQCIDNRKIVFSFKQVESQIILFMKNSTTESVLKKNPSLISKKKGNKQHGYGTKIIKQIVHKHHGFVDYYEENQEFCCNIVLYK